MSRTTFCARRLPSPQRRRSPRLRESRKLSPQISTATERFAGAAGNGVASSTPQDARQASRVSAASAATSSSHGCGSRILQATMVATIMLLKP